MISFDKTFEQINLKLNHWASDVFSDVSSSLTLEQDANILHFLSKSSVDLASICKHVSAIDENDDVGN